MLQITDPHLFADKTRDLLGIVTWDSFTSVINAAIGKVYDFVVITGDISQDYSVESYQHCAEALSVFDCPVFLLPGNHDELSMLERHVVADNFYHQARVQAGNWQLHMLNSTSGTRPGGEFCQQRLEMIEQRLQSGQDHHQMLLMHHNPVLSGSHWLDQHCLKDGPQFLERLSGYPQVKAILWGHIHQAFDQIQNGIRLLASPSTCVQFLPNSHDFALDTLQPGYRLLQLHTDGSIDTQVHRLEGARFIPDSAAQGY